MILSAALFLKVLLVVVAITILLHLFKHNLSKKQLLFGSAIIVIFALAANFVSGFLPPLTETVTLTALGEKQKDAKGMEVFLAGYTIDGKEFSSGKSLKIEEGHWFWSGESYCWRPETDSRQPDGVTRTVVLRIPVGWSRTLDFNSSVWRGKVEIDFAENTWSADTYSQNAPIHSELLGRSSSVRLILNQMRYLAVYTILFLIFSMAAALSLWISIKKPKQVQAWMNNHSGKLIYAAIALITWVFMFHYAGRFSFWYDELLQIYFTKGTIGEAIQCCLAVMDFTPPLPDICATLWYHIAPYGEKWLLLVSIIPTVSAIYIIGMTGEAINGKYCGILAAALMAFSTTVWNNVAYEYRAYAFFVFFSTLSFYFYIKRNQNKEQKSWMVLFSLSITGLIMSHYFGFLVCVGIFMADVYLFLRKQIKFSIVAVYFLPGVIGLLWLTAVYEITMQYKTTADLSGWPPIPGISHLLSLLRFLAGDYDFAYWIFIAGVAMAITYLLKKKSGSFNWERFYIQFSGLIIIFTIILVFVYGNFINPDSTMWVNRYFLGLLPYVLILSSVVIVNTIDMIVVKKITTVPQIAVCVWVIISFSINCLVSLSTPKSNNDPYREAADWIYTQSNYIFNADSLLVQTDWNRAIEGMKEYYITRQGRRDELKIVSQHEKDIIEKFGACNRVYLMYTHYAPIGIVQQELDNSFVLETDKPDIKVKVYVRK